MQNIWIFWATITSATILVIGTLITLYKIVRHKWIIHHNPLIILYLYTARPSIDTEYVLLQIQPKTKLSVEFMCLSFEGSGVKPIIKGLFYCISGRILKNDPIPISVIEDSWVWKCQPPLQEFDFGLAIAFIADKSFDGILKIDLSGVGIDRVIYSIPFKISDIKETHNGFGRKIEI